MAGCRGNAPAGVWGEAPTEVMKMKFLIAEDDATSALVLKKFLSDFGEVTIASDGMEALEVFTDTVKNGDSFDLLCLDVMMPKVSGIEVLSVIRKLEEDLGVAEDARLPIIMMTALSDMDYVDEAFDLGCDGYAAKPVDLDKVEGMMRELGIIE